MIQRVRIAEVLAVLVIAIVAYAIVAPAFHRTHCPASMDSCLSNLRQIAVSLHMYEKDWGSLPKLSTNAQNALKSDAWPGKVIPYLENKTVIYCPISPDRLTYSYNRQISDTRERTVARPAEVVAVFESVNDSPLNNNLNGDSIWTPNSRSLPKPGQMILWHGHFKPPARNWPKWSLPNHAQIGTNACFVDGHVEILSVPGDTIPRFSPK